MAEEQMYSPHFVQVYKTMNSSLPIKVWAEVIGKKLPYFKNNTNVYNTVPLNIKVSGGINDSDGNVMIQVAPTDSDWYSKLQSAVTDMTGQRNIDITTHVGACIKDFTFRQLCNTGELDIVKSNGTIVRIQSSVPPPAHMSTTKLRTIHDWISSNQDPIASAVATSLSGQTMPEIGQSTLKDGPVQKLIEKELQKSKDNFPEFLNTYAMDNVSRTAPGNKVSDLAKSILFHIREGLSANENQIRTFYALQASKQTGDKPLWSQHTASIGEKSKYRDEHSLFLDIAEDAMYNPLLGKKLAHIVYRGNRTQTVRSRTTTRTKKIQQNIRNENQVHPLDQFYKQHYYQKFGKYPGHVMDRFNIENGLNTRNPYPGDPIAAKNAFLLFSGRHVTPIQTNKSELPINRNVNQKQKHTLVPINSDVKQRQKHTLVPINSELPKLVPINSELPSRPARHDKVSSKRTLPPLVPVNKNQKHTLVPINDSVPRNVKPQRKHRLVKIDNEMDSIQREIDAEDLVDPVFGLPTLNSFLKKK